MYRYLCSRFDESFDLVLPSDVNLDSTYILFTVKDRGLMGEGVFIGECYLPLKNIMSNISLKVKVKKMLDISCVCDMKGFLKWCCPRSGSENSFRRVISRIWGIRSLSKWISQILEITLPARYMKKKPEVSANKKHLIEHWITINERYVEQIFTELPSNPACLDPAQQRSRWSSLRPPDPDVFVNFGNGRGHC